MSTNIVSWIDSIPSLFREIIQFLDVNTLVELDKVLGTNLLVRDKFKSVLYDNHKLSCFSRHVFKSDGSYPPLLRFVIDRGIDIDGFSLNVTGYKSAIFWAIDKGHLELVELILAKGSGVMASVSTAEHAQTAPLHQAVYRQRPDIVKLLLKYGADVDARDASFYTSLQGACSESHSASKGYELAQILIEEGRASIDLTDASGQTVLHWESAKGRIKLVELLTRNGADLNMVCELGRTPLHYAVRQYHPAVVEELLTAGAYLDPINGNGRTALIIAAKNGRVEIAESLVARGCDVEVVDWDGKRAVDYVRGNPRWNFLVEKSSPTAPPAPPAHITVVSS